MENLIQSQMDDNFNQEIFKKQQVNVESIFEHIINLRRNVRRKIISTREELNIFFGRIHLYFLPIRNKSIFFKLQKCIFSQLILRNGTFEVIFSVSF